MDAVAELVKKSVFEYLDKRRPDLQPGKIIDLGTKATHYVELLGQGVVDRQVQEVKDSLKCGRRVIVTFSDTRREAADFVRKNGYNAAKPYCEESRRELDSFVSAQPSSSDALRDEARQFADRVQRPWQQFLEQMRTQHESFVGEFDGIFVEQVSELTLNQLTDRDQLTELTESITAMDLDEKLRDLDANLVDLHGDLERAFGSLTVFVELPLKSQAMIQEKVREFERQVREPLSAEMKEQLRKMDAARTTKSKSLIEQVIKDVQDLVTDALREAGAPRSLG
jgi:hypothetical protein